jgi:hypothetical protein
MTATLYTTHTSAVVAGTYITVDAERICDIGFIIDDFKYCLNCGDKRDD